MVRDRFRLGLRAGAEPVAHRLGGSPVQRLPAALQQRLVGRVLDQRVLEAVVGVRRPAVDEEDVGLSELLQRLFEFGLRPSRRPRAAARRKIRARAPSRSSPLRARGQAGRAEQRAIAAKSAGAPARRPAAALQQQPRHFLNEQRHAAGALGEALGHALATTRSAPRFRRPSAESARGPAAR